jgi:hypothetical protein
MTRAVLFASVDRGKTSINLSPMNWQDLETFSFGDGPGLANRLLGRWRACPVRSRRAPTSRDFTRSPHRRGGNGLSPACASVGGGGGYFSGGFVRRGVLVRFAIGRQQTPRPCEPSRQPRLVRAEMRAASPAAARSLSTDPEAFSKRSRGESDAPRSATERPWLQFSGWRPHNPLKPTICSPVGT